MSENMFLLKQEHGPEDNLSQTWDKKGNVLILTGSGEQWQQHNTQAYPQLGGLFSLPAPALRYLSLPTPAELLTTNYFRLF